MGKHKQEVVKKLNQQRQAFLATFFDDESEYEVKEVNGFWLEKHPNGNTGGSEVSIYTKDSWVAKERATAAFEERRRTEDMFRSL